MRELDGSLFGDDQPCFGCGPKHPFGFRLRFREEEGAIVTRFMPGEAHQGPPGVMHGGLVFTLADELAAWAVIVGLGKFGFTVRFSGKLQRPVRPGVDLEGRADIPRQAGRTCDVEVRLSQKGEPVFSGTFVFAVLDTAAAEKLLGRPLPEAWRKFAR